MSEAEPKIPELTTEHNVYSEDEARRAKIEAIRQQLATGSYLISGKDVAGKILEVIKG